MKTYYGPWVDELPEDAPSGSLWQGLHKSDNRTHDFVVVGGEFHHEQNGLDAEWCQQFRRVYPPGSVVPEPRPLVVDPIKCTMQEFGSATHICVGRRFVEGGYGWTTFLASEFRLYRVGMHNALCYPVQPLANGAFVAIPWPDSGCTTE